ncbi:MAG: hypothetical protein AAF211_00200 [Myxococcota bacterium]
MTPEARRFLHTKVRALEARAHRLGRLTPRTLGFADVPRAFVPSAPHLHAANRRLGRLDDLVQRQLAVLRRTMRRDSLTPDRALSHIALVERAVGRSRLAYDLFFDVFSQRSTAYARPLAFCDRVAADCYAHVQRTLPGLLGKQLIPVTYVERSASPGTFRRGVLLKRLMLAPNPFPLVRLPYDRVHSPWGMGVLLHEIAHNLHADLGIWRATRIAVTRRVFRTTKSAVLARVWGNWHKEIFADLAAMLLGGPASAWAMKDFLAYPASRVLTFRPGAVHPSPFLRAFLLAEMLERMGLPGEARRLARGWWSMYEGALHRSRIPRRLMSTAAQVIPEVVDELAYTPYRGLGNHTLAEVIPFARSDARRIALAASAMARGRLPPTLPARLVVSASRLALERGLAPPGFIAKVAMTQLLQRKDVPTWFDPHLIAEVSHE